MDDMKTRFAIIESHNMNLMAISEFRLVRKEDWLALGATYARREDCSGLKRLFNHNHVVAARQAAKIRLKERLGIDLDNYEV